jgi:peptide/nickel transport system permease protein
MSAQYLIRRFLTLIVTVVLVSILAFAAFNVLPGDPALTILGVEASPEKLAALHARLGLDLPLPERYLVWVSGLLRGDLGTSIRFSQPVAALLSSRLEVTLALSFLAFAMILVVSLPLGLIAARNRGRPWDLAVGLGTQLGMAIPPFLLGILLILVFSVILRWASPAAYVSPRESLPGFLACLILPAVAVAVPKAAVVARFLRSSLLDQMGSDYVRTALSKGNTAKRAVYRHALKNALIPVVTVLGVTAADIIAGSLVVEQVFNLPGLGRLLVSSIGYRDFPLIQAMVIYIAVAVALINFLVDLLYRAVDPRIRL